MIGTEPVWCSTEPSQSCHSPCVPVHNSRKPRQKPFTIRVTRGTASECDDVCTICPILWSTSFDEVKHARARSEVDGRQMRATSRPSNVAPSSSKSNSTALSNANSRCHKAQEKGVKVRSLVTFPLKIRKAGTDASVQSGPTFPAGVGSVGSGNKRGFGIGFSVGFAGRSGKRGIAVTILLPRAISLSQVGPDMNEVVGDHRESDPATDAVRPFIE